MANFVLGSREGSITPKALEINRNNNNNTSRFAMDFDAEFSSESEITLSSDHSNNVQITSDINGTPSNNNHEKSDHQLHQSTTTGGTKRPIRDREDTFSSESSSLPYDINIHAAIAQAKLKRQQQSKDTGISSASKAGVPAKRHYKKDSRFVLDLYTLTFDENETVDEIGTCATFIHPEDGGDAAWLSMNPSSSSMLTTAESVTSGLSSMSAAATAQSMITTTGVANENVEEEEEGLDYGLDYGPMSLGPNFFSTETNHQQTHQQQNNNKIVNVRPLVARPKPIPSLETNLLKILARKIQDSEEVSFQKAKLLTKAYYKLLREQPVQQQQQVPQLQMSSSANNKRVLRAKRIGDGRLSWQQLLQTDSQELGRIVKGLSNTVKALNEYLVELLIERDDLLSQQDAMLDEISELTDNLL